MDMLIALIAVLVAVPLVYLYGLTVGAVIGLLRQNQKPFSVQPRYRFAIAIAAHDEEAVIGETVRRLKALDYPSPLFDVHVVADFCSDRTAELAEGAGAISHPRMSGPRGGKGAALSYLFSRILTEGDYGAVVVFDADTKVDREFLRVMDYHLQKGKSVVQGQHQIGNANDGWFPALTEAKFFIDNLIQNFGRTVLGLSAKNMGDSICLTSEVLRSVGWGEGLTEDYQLRQKLLLAGHKITYAAEAIGQGEAPPTWKQARTQRLRWMKGAQDVAQGFRGRLLVEGIKKRSLALLDAALESYLPTFSTVAALLFGTLFISLIARALGLEAPGLRTLFILAGVMLAYPLLGLLLSRAPLRSYLSFFAAPIFIGWRAWAALRLLFTKTEVAWIRTQHGERRA